MDATTALVERLMSEEVMGASAAARLFPAVRGKRLHASTIVAWITRGKRGVRLEGFRGPGKSWLTSRQAVVRFLAALTGRDVATATAPTVSQSARDVAERVARAEAEILLMRERARGRKG